MRLVAHGVDGFGLDIVEAGVVNAEQFVVVHHFSEENCDRDGLRAMVGGRSGCWRNVIETGDQRVS